MPEKLLSKSEGGVFFGGSGESLWMRPRIRNGCQRGWKRWGTSSFSYHTCLLGRGEMQSYDCPCLPYLGGGVLCWCQCTMSEAEEKMEVGANYEEVNQREDKHYKTI